MVLEWDVNTFIVELKLNDYSLKCGSSKIKMHIVFLLLAIFEEERQR